MKPESLKKDLLSMKWRKVTLKKYLKNSNKPKVLMIGPYPPPYGGIANAVENISSQKNLTNTYLIKIYKTGRKNESKTFLIQSLIDIFKIIKFIITLKYKDVNIIHIHTASH